MKCPKGTLAAVLGLAFSVLPVAAHVPDFLEPFAEEQDLEPLMVVNQFLDAVAGAQLSVLGVAIPAGRVVPRRVQFVYDLQTRQSSREVYADLEPPIPLPGQGGCEIRGIDARLDAFGEIVESSAHVWCD